MIVRIVVWGSLAIAAVVVGYIRYTTSKVNGLINEANARIVEGDTKRKELGPEADQFFMGVVPKSFFIKRDEHATAGEDEFLNSAGSKDMVLDRAKLEESVTTVNEVLTQVAKSFRAAAAKFDEGRRVRKSEVVSKYLDLMSQAYQKRAEAEEIRGKAVTLLLDKSIKSQDELRKKCGALINDGAKFGGGIRNPGGRGRENPQQEPGQNQLMLLS